MSGKLFTQGETEVGPLAFHRQMLLVHGISISNIPVFENTNRSSDNTQVKRYREVLCVLSDNNSPSIYYKLRVRLSQPSETPYSLNNEWLFDKGENSTLRLKMLDTGLAERWSGFYSPHLHNDKGDSVWVVRLNPKQTGKCPGNCSFCQRVQSIPTKQEIQARFFLNPDELIEKLLSDTRIPTAENLDRVVVITELFGSEERFLNYLERVKVLLERAGFHGEFSSTAQDLRTRQGVERYKKILEESEFCFTLETFERRRELMGPLKGRPMSEVITLLRYAKESGFQNIVCNYIAGLDSQGGFKLGLSELVNHGVITAMTLNTFTPLTTLQEKLIHPDAKFFSYYLEMWQTRENLGVGAFRPTDYEKSVSFDLYNS